MYGEAVCEAKVETMIPIEKTIASMAEETMKEIIEINNQLSSLLVFLCSEKKEPFKPCEAKSFEDVVKITWNATLCALETIIEIRNRLGA